MNRKRNSGFTLVQLSVLLMIASLVMVTVLPTSQSTADANRVTTERMNDLYKYFRAYMVSNGRLPCPADGTIAQGAANYGVEAAGGGTSSNCSGSTPAANYVNAAQTVAVGMVPVRTLGLPNEYAYDGWGRAITYAVDTNVTGSCWTTPAAGAITVTDNGAANSAVMALISHGANGHGAFIPLAGASGTAVRFNNNSSDTNELLNAHVDSSFNAATTNLNNFVKTAVSATFDDIIVYSAPAFSMNTLPAAANSNGASITSITTPLSGAYYVNDSLQGMATAASYSITFTVRFSAPVYVTGTPRLALTATSVGGGTVSLTNNGGGGATGYANYTGGGGSTMITFTYPVLLSDMAPNGMSVASPIDLNGGTMTTLCGTPTFTPPSLSSVIIPKMTVLTTSGTWTVPADWNNSFNYIEAIGSGGNGAAGGTAIGGGGGGSGAYAGDKNCTLTTGTVYTSSVGAAGSTTFSSLVNGGTTLIKAAYGSSASAGTAGAANSGSATMAGCALTINAGAAGGAGGTALKGGGGGGAGASGASGVGKAGGAGATPSTAGGGGGGGGGGADSASAGAGAANSATGAASAGSKGGKGYTGSAPSNAGAAAGGAGGVGTAAIGAGGGGGGGTNAASTNGGAGGNGSLSLGGGPGAELAWMDHSGAYYAAGSGGGGSGGANGTTSNSGAGGNAGIWVSSSNYTTTSYGFGGGGGGSGAATGTAGAVGAGNPGVIIITYR